MHIVGEDCLRAFYKLFYLRLVIQEREAATRNVLKQEAFFEISQKSQENIRVRVSFLIKLQVSVCNFIKKETLTQVFSCKFCEISKNTFFTEHLWMAASEEISQKGSVTYAAQL